MIDPGGDNDGMPILEIPCTFEPGDFLKLDDYRWSTHGPALYVGVVVFGEERETIRLTREGALQVRDYVQQWLDETEETG